MKIVSWNVNSIKARLGHVQRFLKETAPDVLMLQELKGLDFPASDFESLGYHTAAVPQKAYNGVAVFSKTEITVISDTLAGDDADEQARYIEFETNGLRLINIYLPNGNPVFEDNDQQAPEFHEKYTYKLGWMERLYMRLKELRAQNIPFIIGGDFNVMPEDRDCHDPKAWTGDALFRQETWNAFRKLEHLGLYDAFRIVNDKAGFYTFWDYQAGAWQQDKGIRIDHFLLSPELSDRLINCTIDKTPRSWEKPSDHTPIMIEITA